ncbi:MAG: hypothetical protein QOJ65_636 [Fimbriimonadaceae bacterium]|jgi:MFS family permease|nr:hypothetical protein [Fimbriimonadaceae bacterium]
MRTLRALKSRNYRLFFFGQAVSLVGTWMDSVAMQWLVYSKTGSAELLGVTAFFTLVPAFIIGPFAGVMVDRFDKRKLLLFTQSVQMLQAGAIAALVFTNTIQIWMVLALSVVAGLVGAIDMPTRQAFMIDLVEDREDLSNAIALNSSQFNLARLIGPAVAGFVYELVGAGYCFLINALSFFAVLVALYMLRTPKTSNPQLKANVFQSIRDGASYVKHFVPVRALILLLAAVSFLAGAQAVMMPVMAKQAFHGNASTLGLIQSAIGAGALASALMLASRKSVVGLGKWIMWSVLLFGSSLIALAFVRNLPLALVLLTLAGAGFMTQMAATNTLVQSVVDDAMRGRVMSFYTMAFVGTMPFGSLLAGYVAGLLDRHGIFGAPVVLAAVGGLLVTSGLFFLRAMPRLREAIRPAYIEKGILTA